MNSNEIALQMLQAWLNSRKRPASPKMVAQAYLFFLDVVINEVIPEDASENEDC